MTIIVTGGAGFIGCNLVRGILAHRSERVVVFDKLTYAGKRENLADLVADPRYSFVHGDIADTSAVAALFAAQRPTAILNLAAESHVDRSIDDPAAFVTTNVVGTFELLDAARRHFEALPKDDRAAFRFLHVSTDEVYGSLAEDGRFTEATPYDPSSPYAASKAAADHLVRAYWRTFGVPTLVTNCTNNYGPYQLPEKLIPLMILNAAGARDLPVYGDGLNVRDWIHVDDHCRGILLALDHGRPGESYNLGAECERTNLETVELICTHLEAILPAARNSAMAARGAPGYKDLLRFVGDRPGHDRRYAVDPRKAREEFGFAPAIDFADGLGSTVRWYLEHRDWCAAVGAENLAGKRLGHPTGVC